MRRFLRNWTGALSLILCAALPFSVFAQDKVISGKVSNQKDRVDLPGVTIAVKGSAKKTTTDKNGNYQITAFNADVLVFSFVGYAPKEVNASSAKGNTLNVELVENNTNLDEVVVVGYGTQKKSDVTGSVVSLDKKRLEELPNTNFYQALQGALPGVTVDQSSGGAEGNSSSIHIRGRKSITASTTPLVILDGIPYNGSISDLNPSDIESIDVLKDASAAAIYGSRGSNGVILVTTKKGSRGKPVISYNGSYGFQQITRLPEMLNPDDFYQFKITREPNSISLAEQAVYDSRNFPNWLDLATRTGNRNQQTLGVSGGSENSKYYVSATYLDVKGVAVNDNFKRLSTRINLETNITKWLTFGSNSQLSYNDRSGIPAYFSGDNGAYRFNPLTVAYNADGSQAIYPYAIDVHFANPLSPTLADNSDLTYKVITNNYLQVALPLKGLSYRLNTGIEYTNRDQSTYWPRTTKQGLEAKGDLSLSGSNDRNLIVENILNFNRSFGKHTVSFTGLYSYEYNNIHGNTLDAAGFPNDVLTYYQAGVALSNNPGASYSKEILLSQMARVNYSYNEKYLLTVTARRDGYSSFGANNKYGFFPSVALGWNITNEDFMKDNKVINNLKLRLSYGSNGNQAVGAYKTLAKLSERSYVDGTTTAPGYIPTTLGDPNLHWETTNTANAGIDFGLLKGRINGTLDAYVSKTHDLLLDRLISPVHGVSSITQNIGKTENKGVELGLSTINIQGEDFSWTSTANISINRNKIIDLYGDAKSDTANRWFIGQPIDVNFDYIYDGVWQTGEDFTKAPQPNVVAGYAKVRDLNGDGKITPQGDKTIIGSLEPDFTWGLGNNFKYKNFSLYVFVHGVQGTSRSNPYMVDDVNSGVRYNTVKKNWWTPTNPTNDYYANAIGANVYGAHIFQSDSFMRIKDISLGYDLSSKLLQQLKLTRFKIYVSARNLFTITKWTALDPELTDGGQREIPLQKEFTLGLNISL